MSLFNLLFLSRPIGQQFLSVISSKIYPEFQHFSPPPLPLTQITIISSLNNVLTDPPAFTLISLLRAANLIWLKPELNYVTSLLKTLSFPISLRPKTKIFTRIYKSLHDLGPLQLLIFSPATLSLISSTPATLTSLLDLEENMIRHVPLKAFALAYSLVQSVLTPPTPQLLSSTRSFFKSSPLVRCSLVTLI